MKKKSWLVVLLAAIVALVGIGALTAGCDRTPSNPTQDYVDYYGCPNSKRVRRLNTKKSREA